MGFKAKFTRGQTIKPDHSLQTPGNNNKNYIGAKEIIRMQTYCKTHVIRDRGASRGLRYEHYNQIEGPVLFTTVRV